ncbi:serine/threonine-protein kinase [Yoonia sp. 2307UL14-13]|uniref:serine/threonine-protein kinase n=1 Tax=Yoonia sp. 2307UL14-13 TaxID=3126506 RepID=UPI0030A00045
MTATQSAGMEEEKNEALPDGTLLLGDQFTILRQLGKGGFGITYLAQDNYLDRDVVIKECFPEVFCHRSGKSVLVRSTANSDKYRSLVDMFMREARSIAKLRHPNIIGVHRVFEDNDTAYMALDMINGRDLQEIVKNDPNALSPKDVKEILLKLLDAVSVVHQQDLLHRDISPDNILLDKWGTPVLIDFGAAREEASRETRALSAVLVVKDGYSPQEFYFSGGKQTPSSDLYALAATFYHVVSGNIPPNSQTRMAEVASGNPDPCEPLQGRFDAYDDRFLAAIDKGMRVLPKERLQSAQEWLDMLDPSKAAAKPLELSPKKDLSKALTRLISETNEYVRKSEPKEEKPRPVPQQKPRVEVPDWVREFNEETETLDKKPAQKPRAEPLVLENTLKLENPVRKTPAIREAVAAVVENTQTSDQPVSDMPKGLRDKLRRRLGRIRSSWL